jgi:hypothetical protein
MTPPAHELFKHLEIPNMNHTMGRSDSRSDANSIIA